MAAGIAPLCSAGSASRGSGSPGLDGVDLLLGQIGGVEGTTAAFEAAETRSGDLGI